jgi:hypothetical protein
MVWAYLNPIVTEFDQVGMAAGSARKEIIKVPRWISEGVKTVVGIRWIDLVTSPLFSYIT